LSNQDQNVGDSIVFAGFDGLRNTTSRERLKPSELEAAINVDLDDEKQIRRRRGYSRVGASGSYHSLYGDSAGLMLVVKDGVLCRLFQDYTTSALLAGAGGEYFDYVRVAGDVYFSSRVTSGKYSVSSNAVSSWGQVDSTGTWLSPVVNPTATLGQVNGKLLGKPPMATALTYYNGRIYLAQGSTLWCTELYLYDYVDKTRTFYQFESDVTMLEAVSDGVYVGTEDAVYFLQGDAFPLKREVIINYGAVRGSAVSVPAELIKPAVTQELNSPVKNAIMFLTKSGVVAGFDSGITYNMTQSEVLFPDAKSAAVMFRRQDGLNQYIAVTDSGGTPGSKAAIGDYIDAQIVRAIDRGKIEVNAMSISDTISVQFVAGA
jgi:hypothetical protein